MSPLFFWRCIAVVSLVAGSANEPTADSNYGVYTGSLAYTDSYGNARPYGILSGRATVRRSATSPMSAISVAVFFEDEVDHMPASDLSAVLHTGGCQDPTATTLTCDIAVAGRARTYSSTPPDMPNGDCDSGDQPVLPLSAGLYNGREYLTAYYEWPVHISHAAAGQGMSLILLNRTDPGGNPNAAPDPLACADLFLDRVLEGTTGFMALDVENSMVVLQSAELRVNELGHTGIYVEMGNLRGGALYPTYLHTLPCIAGRGGVPGPRFKRNVACLHNPMGNGCASSPESEVWLGLQSSTPAGDRGSAAATLDLPIAVGASAQSLVVHDCLVPAVDFATTGNCTSELQLIYCVNLVNEMYAPDFSSTELPTQPTDGSDSTDHSGGNGRQATLAPGNGTTPNVNAQDKNPATSTPGDSVGDGADRVNDGAMWTARDGVACPAGAYRSKSKGHRHGVESMVMEGFAAGGAGGSRCCLARDVDTAQWGKSSSLSARPSPGQTGSTYSGGEVAMVAALLVAIATTTLVAKIRLKKRDGRVSTMDEYASIPLPMPNKGSPYVDLSRASAAPDSPSGTPFSQHAWVPGCDDPESEFEYGTCNLGSVPPPKTMA